MNVERRSYEACVLLGKIYVVGGLDANNQVVKLIECFNPETDEWTLVGETKQELHRCLSFIVEHSLHRKYITFRFFFDSYILIEILINFNL